MSILLMMIIDVVCENAMADLPSKVLFTPSWERETGNAKKHDLFCVCLQLEPSLTI